MRVDLMLGAAATALAVVVLCGCSPAGGSTLTVREDGGAEQPVTVADLICTTAAGRFSASSTKSRVGELSAFTATVSADSGNSATWVSLGDDRWFMTTEAFEHDGAVTFDKAEGRIGTSKQGYPTEFEASGTIDGELTCTVQKNL